MRRLYEEFRKIKKKKTRQINFKIPLEISFRQKWYCRRGEWDRIWVKVVQYSFLESVPVINVNQTLQLHFLHYKAGVMSVSKKSIYPF